MTYLQSIDVRYGEDPSSEPSDGIHTVDGTNADINAGFGGEQVPPPSGSLSYTKLTGLTTSFVWLVPRYNSNAANAVSNIRIIIQGDPDSAYVDLAKGAGGDYRYLRLERDGGNKITEVRLLRRNDEADSSVVRALGFDGASGDINKGRGGDYLYVVWKY